MNNIMDTYNDWKGGRRYYGESKNGKEHGLGFYELDAFKQKFVGEFVDGKAHGLGMKIQGPGKDWSRTIVCEFNENEHSGIGAYRWNNGAKFIGTYKNDVAKGPGMFITWEGFKYIGNFSLDDDVVGVKGIGMKGDDYWIRGDGQWYNKNDVPLDITELGYDIHGFKRVDNKEFWPNGCYYEGEFDDRGLYSGFGRYWYSKTRYYEGEFLNGYFHGQGFDYYDDDNWLKGTYENGAATGYGEAKFDHGSYEGGWRNYRFHGEGKLIYKGSIYEGTFHNITINREGGGMDTGFIPK